MADDHAESIFDFASKQSRQPSKRKSGQTSQPPSPPQPAIEVAREGAEQLITDLFDKGEKLNRRLDETYRLSGHTRDTILEYLNSPSNFSETTWKMVQQQRESFRLKINILETKSTTQELRQIKKGQEQKKRKGKTLGARRNWLSM